MTPTWGYSLKINKSENEGTAKAEKSSQPHCLWGCLVLECITGEILMDGRTNIINIVQKQYLLLVEITKCHAFLSEKVICNVRSKLTHC